MRLKAVELGGKLISLVVPEDSLPYRRITTKWYAETWHAHPTVWEMHMRNGQFVDTTANVRHPETGVITTQTRNALPATKHCVAQAKRAEVLARLLGLPRWLIYELVAGVLLTDSYKLNEWLLMQRKGACWDTYAEAQALAHASWVTSEMFSPNVLTIASSVAHESLLQMLLLCDKYDEGTDLTPLEVAQLIAHFADDISQDHAWVTEREGNTNVLTQRILVRNASNPTYMTLNQEGRTRLWEEANAAGYPEYFTSNQTTYEAQAEVGLRVQALLSTLLSEKLGGVRFNPLDLPVIIDNVLRRRFNRQVPVLFNFEHPPSSVRSFTYGGPGWNSA
jgi:hypothetical protein